MNITMPMTVTIYDCGTPVMLFKKPHLMSGQEVRQLMKDKSELFEDLSPDEKKVLNLLTSRKYKNKVFDIYIMERHFEDEEEQPDMITKIEYHGTITYTTRN